jgi:lipoprotein-anchoring transpeptidase ErfK/SrfK
MLVAALASIAAGGTVIAVAAGGRSSPSASSGADRGRSPTPSEAPIRLKAVPIVIPPAPSLIAIPPEASTTIPAPVRPAPVPVTPTPYAGSGTSGGAGRSAARSRVALPALPVGDGAATNVTDPSVVAIARVRTLPLYAAPGAPGPSATLANPNNLGAAVVLLVTASQTGWVEAYVPMRPNETQAWIPAADVATTTVPDHIVVHLGARDLILYHDNVPVFTAPVAPGAPDSPTPTGSFFVAYKVRVTDPSGPYGPDALGTSDFSGTYTSFEGGPGQIGIHGTDQPWVIGTDASHGCIRLLNSAIATLAPQVDPGTPVEVEH